MSRTVIAAVVALVIAGLTAIAYFVTSQSFEERARKDADVALTRAYQVVQRLNQLQGIDISNKAERLAALPEFIGAIRSSGDDRRRQAQLGFQKFMSADKEGAIKPDIIALVDDSGDMLAMHEVPTVVPK
jgi:LPS O-antigen subunit length determinant protein (WzzB/FepE family)